MKAVKFDVSGGGAAHSLEKAITSLSSWYIQCQLGVFPACLTALVGSEGALNIGAYTAGQWESVGIYGGPPTVELIDTSGSGTGSPFPANTWNTIVGHFASGTLTWYLNGSSWDSYAETFSSPTNFQFGALSPLGVPNEIYYIADVRIGTTLGGTDIFADDFHTGSFAAGWDSTTGGVIVADPFVTPDIGGVLIAFDDPALGANPTFTRLDDRAGVNVSTIQVKRGRPDERSKSSVGTATINGFDLVGDTDPTNAAGPFYGKLDPVKQTQVLLYNPVAAAWSPIFTGYTDDWTHDLDEGAKKLDFQLDCSDMLEMLNDAEIVPDQAGNTVPGESAGDVYYTGAHVDDRLKAVLADLGSDFPSGVFQQTWPSALLNIFTGNVNVVGRVYASRTTLLQVVDEACDAEFPGVSNRFVGKDGVFDFRGRKARYNADAYTAGSGNAGTARVPGSTPALHWYVGDMAAYALDSTLSVYTALKFTRGKANLINAALVTPFGIAAADISGQFVYDATSVGLYGPRTSGMSLQDLITGDSNDDGNDRLAETKCFGQATIDNYKNPVTRVSQIVFRNPFDNNAATWLLLCGIELSDLITITSSHPGGGGFSAVDFFVEGITYNLTPHRGNVWNVTLTLDVSPRAYYATDPFPGG